MEFNGECCSGFGFGFNDVNYSDRTIRLHILPDPDSDRKTKRRRFDGLQHTNGHEEAVQTNENVSTTDCCSTQEKIIHINTLILAARSPFFYKLFSNGMAESSQRHVTLQIQESEEASFMDLLKFMYTNTLSGSTQNDLLDVLMIADKYEVSFCMKYCFQLLSKLPMTCELALYYLELPSTVLRADKIRSLTNAAKEFLVGRFKDISKFWDEMFALPLIGIEAILSSDDLQVDSEDGIYDFVVKWAGNHYTNLDERQEILTKRLLHLIRFQFMSCHKLKEVINCLDINLEVTSKLFFHALSFKIPHPHQPHAQLERAYKHRPVKVMYFNLPTEECVVYLDLKHEECSCLLPSGQIRSQPFDFTGQTFYLLWYRHVDESTVSTFNLSLGTENKGLVNLETEFSWRTESGKFVGNLIRDYSSTGPHDLFVGLWDGIKAKGNPLFFNGVLHVRLVIRFPRTL